jgi:hypothetical protein
MPRNGWLEFYGLFWRGRFDGPTILESPSKEMEP